MAAISWEAEHRTEKSETLRNKEYPRQKRVTYFLGPRFVRHKDTQAWVDFHSTSSFMQNAYCALEVYPDHVRLFDPEGSAQVGLEHFLLQYHNGLDWEDLPTTPQTSSVLPDAGGVITTLTFDTPHGIFRVEYDLRTAAPLKHNITFTNSTQDTHTYRVVLQVSQIPSKTIWYHELDPYRIVSKTLQDPLSLVRPYFAIGETEQSPIYQEHLHKLGTTKPLTREWTPRILQEIRFIPFPKDLTVQVFMGPFLLAPREALEIDPTTTTYKTLASADDAYYDGTWGYADATNYHGYFGIENHTFWRWALNVTDGSTIDSAYLKIYIWSDWAHAFSAAIRTLDLDNCGDYTTDRSGQSTVGNIAWDQTSYGSPAAQRTSPDIKTQIQAFIDRVAYASGNYIGMRLDEGDAGADEICASHTHDEGTDAYRPRLEVTYTAPAPPAAGVTRSLRRRKTSFSPRITKRNIRK
jgi:hypothetical protein